MSIEEQIIDTQDKIIRMRDALAGVEEKIKAATCDLNLVGNHYRKELKMLDLKMSGLWSKRNLTVFNKKLALSAVVMSECLTCNGTGHIDSGFQTAGSICDKCGGTGKDAGNI